MNNEKEMNDLTKRIDELETCCAEFRACKGKIGERIDKLEHRLDDLRSEVKTLYTSWSATALAAIRFAHRKYQNRWQR